MLVVAQINFGPGRVLHLLSSKRPFSISVRRSRGRTQYVPRPCPCFKGATTTLIPFRREP